MKNINFLIADDVESNVTLLEYTIKSFKENERYKNKFIFNIFKASNGREAIEMCENETIHILFVDILMPEINGIEATKLIRKANKKILIVAVSTSNDIVHQREILEAGAEDYILKPIQVDIFKARFNTYLQMALNRNSKTENFGKITPFSDQVNFRRISYFFDSGASINEFWEYYQTNKEQFEVRALTEVLRIIFSLATLQVENDIYSELYIEMNEKFKFFTLININKLEEAKVINLLNKNKVPVDYILIDDRISFKFSRNKDDSQVAEELIYDEKIEKQLLEDELVAANFLSPESLEILDSYLVLIDENEEYGKLIQDEMQNKQEEKITSSDIVNIPNEEQHSDEIDLDNLADIQEIQETKIPEKERPKKVYLDFFEQNDRDMLEDSIESLSNLFVFIEPSNISKQELRNVVILIESMKRVLIGYSETFIFAQMLGEIARYLLSENSTLIDPDKNSELIKNFQKFSELLSVWYRLLFIDGAPSIEFLDEKINMTIQKILDDLRAK
jgi:CheY-like chemotaxis protein/sulfur carrier protein ThiS